MTLAKRMYKSIYMTMYWAIFQELMKVEHG